LVGDDKRLPITLAQESEVYDLRFIVSDRENSRSTVAFFNPTGRSQVKSRIPVLTQCHFAHARVQVLTFKFTKGGGCNHAEYCTEELMSLEIVEVVQFE